MKRAGVIRWLLVASVGLLWSPVAVQAQISFPTVAPASAQPKGPVVTVALDLNNKDRYSKAFSDAVTAAVNGDPRFQVTDKLPPDGVKIIMDDAISYDADNSAETAAYAVNLKLGSGKFVTKLSGYCDVKRWEMCGRVVAQDTYDAYIAYTAKH